MSIQFQLSKSIPGSAILFWFWLCSFLLNWLVKFTYYILKKLFKYDLMALLCNPPPPPTMAVVSDL